MQGHHHANTLSISVVENVFLHILWTHRQKIKHGDFLERVKNDAVILRPKRSCRMVESNSRTGEGTTVEKADD